MAGPLDDLRKPLNLEPGIRRAAQALQKRNVASLQAAQGPGGEPLARNRPYTEKRKRHGRVGFHTGEMAAGLLAPGAVIELRIGDARAEAVVGAGPGNTDMKVNIFVRGQPERVIEKTARIWKKGSIASRQLKGRAGGSEIVQGPGGVWKWKRVVPAVPGRDFLGVDEADVDAAAEGFLSDFGAQWGFAEGGG